jgi:hypothetical protein
MDTQITWQRTFASLRARVSIVRFFWLGLALILLIALSSAAPPPSPCRNLYRHQHQQQRHRFAPAGDHGREC